METVRDTPLTLLAARIAEDAHSGQVDKIGEPYFNHPQTVAYLVTTVPTFHALSSEDREHAVAAAFLHDVLEDTSVTAEDMASMGIPINVIDTVHTLTHPHQELRMDYYGRVRRNPIARIVKIADVAHNSSVDRLTLLDFDLQKRLIAKYNKASSVLLDTSEEASWFATVTA